MKFTRQQRINNQACFIVQELTRFAEQCQKWLKDGLDIPAEAGYPRLTATGEEVRDALGENAKPVETAIEFILEGKSNRITKGAAKKK